MMVLGWETESSNQTEKQVWKDPERLSLEVECEERTEGCAVG